MSISSNNTQVLEPKRPLLEAFWAALDILGPPTPEPNPGPNNPGPNDPGPNDQQSQIRYYAQKALSILCNSDSYTRLC